VRTTDLAGGQVLWDAESGRTTMLDRILEQEKKLREMDDMRVHQEKMVKLAKIRQQQEAEGKRGGRVPGAAGGDGDLADDGGDAFGGGEGIAAGRMEQLMRELPDKIVHAMGHAGSPGQSGPKKRLATALDAAAATGGGGGGATLGLVAHDGGSRHDADDRSQVSHGDHGEPGFGRGLSFGGGLGKDGGGSSHGGGGGTDTDVLLAAIAEVREAQRAQSRDVADLRKDVAQLQSTMAEILAALKQGGSRR
jgi:hypothetical protein